MFLALTSQVLHRVLVAQKSQRKFSAEEELEPKDEDSNFSCGDPTHAIFHLRRRPCKASPDDALSLLSKCWQDQHLVVLKELMMEKWSQREAN